MLINLAQFLSQPLLIDHSYATSLAGIARLGNIESLGEPVKNDVRMAAERQAGAAKSSGSKITAVLPVYGMIDQRDSWVLEFLGGTSVQSLMEAVDICLNEPRITGVVFDCSSPGGSSFGVKECSDYIAKARSQVPMVSLSNCLMASACYYIGSATSRIYASPSSLTGSVGVYIEHYEESKALEQQGIKTTVIRIPEGKAEGHPAEQLSDAAMQQMMARCEEIYNQFTGDVGRYRGISQQMVKDSYGMGRCLSASDALACGMVDKIATFTEVIDQMQSGTIARSLAQSGRMEGAVDAAVMRNRLAMASL